jgi:multiple sugar transport system permease protein
MGYIEAAKIDGSSELGTFFRIILPLSAPIVSVVAIFSVIGSWGNFFWPYLVLGNTELEPISVLLYKITGATSQFKDNDRLLIMFMAAVPSIIVFAVLSKRIMGGLNMSGIKG